MSGPRTNTDHLVLQAARPDKAEHAVNAQWLKDNPSAMPQVGVDRWAVYDREGNLRGHLIGGGPTRDTRFKAVEDGASDSHGITLHDAGAHLLDATGSGVESASTVASLAP